MAVVVPVIHHIDLATTLANAEIAAAAGCDGVLLIQMDGRDHELDAPAVEVKRLFPALRVGTNRLVMEPREAVDRDRGLGLDCTWSDSPGVTSRAVGRRAEAAARAANRAYRFYGSVAFKGQPHEPDPARAAVAAAALGWVVTTSGPATGIAPEVGKLRAMREAIPDASGVAPDNASLIAPLVDEILVATGISRSFHEFDPSRLSALMDVVRETGRRV